MAICKKETIEGPTPLQAKDVRKDFEEFILEEDHPCIMAQSVFQGNHLDFHVFPELGSQEATLQILRDLTTFLANYEEASPLVVTFMAVFPSEHLHSEEEFETLLWKQLQQLHNADTQPWDPQVSADPADAEFSFSLVGKAFFMVGLHPNSSRMARRAPYPAIAFNLHSQFEKLREQGRFELVKQKIREREIQLQGEINPMLRDFGKESEARQYSGRKVGEEWKCPFLHKKK